MIAVINELRAKFYVRMLLYVLDGNTEFVRQQVIGG